MNLLKKITKIYFLTEHYLYQQDCRRMNEFKKKSYQA